MSWRDLLSKAERVAYPWTGGREVRTADRAFALEGALPEEHGWYELHTVDGTCTARTPTLLGQRRGPRRTLPATVIVGPCAPAPETLRHPMSGYLVGDLLVGDHQQVVRPSRDSPLGGERVHFVEPGLDLFVRVRAARPHEAGPLVFVALEMPLGPEAEVLSALLDGQDTLDAVRGVPPALDAAFRIERWRRLSVERRRVVLEQQRQEEQQRLLRDSQRRELLENFGDGAGRRVLASFDFAEAARSALAVGGAEYLDHRAAPQRGEVIVRFRLRGRRFECTCDGQTLRIVDAGICLTDHQSGERGDGYFTLESLPMVIREAESTERLVVLRQVGR